MFVSIKVLFILINIVPGISSMYRPPPPRRIPRGTSLAIDRY